MLAPAKLGADFSRGCAGKSIGLAFLVTHPRPSIRELTMGDTPRCPIGPDLCSNVDTDFGEYPSVLKNSLDARFRPRSGTKTPVLGRFELDLWSLSAQSRLFQHSDVFPEGG
jgi:hypothetical protein